MLSYRSLKKVEMKTFYQMNHYAFALHKGKKDFTNDDYWKIIGGVKGLFDNEKLKTSYILYDFKCRLRDKWFRTGGIGNVVSPPENRRQGYTGKLLSYAISEMKEKGMALSALWPFSYAFYRKYGWEQINGYRKYILSPEQLAFADENSLGSFKKVGPDKWEQLNYIYHAAYQKYDLEIARDKEWWQERILKDNQKNKYAYFWEKDGRAKGYIIYSVKNISNNQWEREMVVDEMLAVDFEAYIQLLRFLYYHDSQIKQINISAPEDDPLIKIIPNPRIKNNYVPGVMFRIIDLKKLLNSLDYPDLKIRITMKVMDSQASWNNGNFILEAENGNGNINKIDENSDTDITIGINHLAMIITGFITASEAKKLNIIKSKNKDKIRGLDRL
ncbi:MAG TPA: GNAT family N-acetyltransferase, partial [Halanaerobiales bacterium]|nr:GNAT family N-acetyltransferase [Halanaerobiales bacterium]